MSGFVIYGLARYDSVKIDTLYDHTTHKSAFADYFKLFSLYFPDPSEGAYRPDTVGVTALGMPGSPDGLPIDYNDVCLTITVYCPKDPWLNYGRSICIDSASPDPNTPWKWYSDQTEFVPEFQSFSGIPSMNGFCWGFQAPCYSSSGANGQVSPNCPTCGSICCTGARGNVNAVGITDLADLSLLIAYLPSAHNLRCHVRRQPTSTALVSPIWRTSHS